MADYIHHMLKTAGQAPLSIKAPQPVQPLFQSEGGSEQGTPAPAPFPAGPQSLNAGAPDESEAMAAAAEQQKVQAEEESRKQQAQLELHKTREELLAVKSEQMQQSAQAQAQQAQLEAQQARTEAQLESAQARDQLVAEKEKALDQHMKRMDKVKQLESRPTLLTSTADRLSKKVESMGNQMKYAFVALHKHASVTPPKPAASPAPTPPSASTQPTANPLPTAPAQPTAPIQPTAPVQPTAPSLVTVPSQIEERKKQLIATYPEIGTNPDRLQRMATDGRPIPSRAQVVRESQQRINAAKQRGAKAEGDWNNSLPGLVDNTVSNFVNDSPDYYKERVGDNLLGKTMDYGLSRVVDPLRSSWLGGGDLARGNYTGALKHWGDATTSGVNTITTPLVGAGVGTALVGGVGKMVAPGLARAAVSKVPGLAAESGMVLPQALSNQVARLPGISSLVKHAPGTANVLGSTAKGLTAAFAPGMATAAPGAAASSLDRWAGGPDNMTPDRHSLAWRIGPDAMSKEQELMQQDRANRASGIAGSTRNAEDMQALQSSGYHHADSFMPFQNQRSRFSNPWVQTAADTFGPMLYPQVNMGQYTGQPSQFDPYGRARSMASMMFPQLGNRNTIS